MGLKWLWSVHVGATLYMLGLIWFVQLVHYPLMSKVGTEKYADYQQLHMQWTSLAVGPPMLLEALTTALLLWFRPPALPVWSVWMAAGLLGAVWLSTALFQVPAHQALLQGFDSKAHQRLVRSNGWRTALWTLRAGLVLWMTSLLLKL